MTYALIKNGAVVQHPYSFNKLREDNPGVSYPKNPNDVELEKFDVFLVARAAHPPYDPTKNIRETTPALVKGVWTQQWEQIDATAYEIARRAKEATQIADNSAMKADAWVNAFKGMTLAELDAYLDANVTNLLQAREVLKKLAIIVHVLHRDKL